LTVVLPDAFEQAQNPMHDSVSIMVLPDEEEQLLSKMQLALWMVN
jgi:hypothetical protein